MKYEIKHLRIGDYVIYENNEEISLKKPLVFYLLNAFGKREIGMNNSFVSILKPFKKLLSLIAIFFGLFTFFIYSSLLALSTLGILLVLLIYYLVNIREELINSPRAIRIIKNSDYMIFNYFFAKNRDQKKSVQSIKLTNKPIFKVVNKTGTIAWCNNYFFEINSTDNTFLGIGKCILQNNEYKFFLDYTNSLFIEIEKNQYLLDLIGLYANKKISLVNEIEYIEPPIDLGYRFHQRQFEISVSSLDSAREKAKMAEIYKNNKLNMLKKYFLSISDLLF